MNSWKTYLWSWRTCSRSLFSLQIAKGQGQLTLHLMTIRFQFVPQNMVSLTHHRRAIHTYLKKFLQSASENNRIPGATASEKSPCPSVEGHYSDLLRPKEKENNHPRPPAEELNVCDEIFSMLDKEMPDILEYGDNVPKNLATRITNQFTIKSESSDALKLVTGRQKIPANCAEVCVPKLRDSVLNMKSFLGLQQEKRKIPV